MPVVLMAFAAMGIVPAVVAAPLLVYSGTLATFGIAHVLSELRYLDHRFSRRLGAGRLAGMGVLLLAAAAARACGVLKLVPGDVAVVAELALVAILALTAADGAGVRGALALTLGAGLGIATLASPFDTLIALSILHNFTPLVFLWEIAPGRQRPATMALAGGVFIGLPLLIATGWPREALAALGLGLPALDPLHAGPLADQLYVYVPRPLLNGAHATDLFSAGVMAQCAHYVAVLLVLPALLASRDPCARGLVLWPRGDVLVVLLVVVSALVLARFAHGFADARALYGIASSIHAWVELPLIIIAMTPTRLSSAAAVRSAARRR